MVGPFDPEAATNWRLLRAFEEVKISYSFFPTPYKITPRVFFGIIRYFKKHKNHCSHIWVTSLSHQIFPFLYLAIKIVWPLRRPPIVYDSLISIYDTRVFDRGWVSQWSSKASYYYFLDWFACKISDRIIVDTNEHGKYFQKQFRCKKDKIRRVFAGANRERFYPREESPGEHDLFTISFHGKLIPGMSGSEYLVEAARVLKNENIRFRIMGKGKLLRGFEEIKKEEHLDKLELTSWIEPKKLPDYLAESDAMMGAFGTTPKAEKAIPLKVFEGLAMGKALIVGDSPAARELFVDGVQCIFARRGDAKDFIEKIMFLKNNPDKRKTIARNGYDLYSTVLSHETIGKELRSIFEGLMI